MANGQQFIFATDSKFERVATVLYPGNGVADFAIPTTTRVQLPCVYPLGGMNLRLTGTVTVVGAGPGALTLEQPFTLVRSVKIQGSSQVRKGVSEIKYADLAALYQLQHIQRGVAGPVTPLAIPGAQVGTPIAFDVPIDFKFTRSVDPRVTLLNSRQLSSFDLIIEWGVRQDVIVGGADAVTFNNVQLVVSLEEWTDKRALSGNYGIYRLSFIEQPFGVAAIGFSINLKQGNVLRGFLIKQFTQAAVGYHTPVNTILTGAVKLNLNRLEKLSYDSFQLLSDANAWTYRVAAMPLGYAMLDLAKDGRMDQLIDTRQFDAVEVLLDVAAIANGRVRIYPIEIIPVG